MSLLLVAAASQPSSELLRAAGAVGLSDAFEAGVLEDQSDRIDHIMLGPLGQMLKEHEVRIARLESSRGP